MKFPIVNQASPLFLATIIGIVNVRHVASAKCGDPWREPCLGDTDARYKTDRNYDIEAQSDLAVGQSLPSHSEDSVGLIMHARIPARRCTICAMSAKRFQSLMVCLSWSGPSALRNPTSILTYGTNSFIHPSIICLAPLHYLLFDHTGSISGILRVRHVHVRTGWSAVAESSSGRSRCWTVGIRHISVQDLHQLHGGWN
uniref:Uncharacterized protein n=1 Tax=Craspedostauros australis TaxID=1486917 RepID=A0A7R9WVR3_9STRA